MYLPIDGLITESADLLGLETGQIGDGIASLAQREEVEIEPINGAASAVWLSRALAAEVEGAYHVERLCSSAILLSGRADAMTDEAIDACAARMGVELAGAQREAVRAAWEDKVVVITGGPGTGKTTIVRAMVEIGESTGAKIALAAPTGRAAKRLAQACGKEAKTLHRLLEFGTSQRGFGHDQEAPLDVDMLIVDESSMIDSYLLRAIVRALPDQARLIFVGDIDQLPSVGPGDVLRDIIGSGVVRTVRLTEIFRQASSSHIVRNAHRINSGQLPIAPPREEGQLSDFYAIEVADPERVRDTILDLVTDRIPHAFGFDPLDDLQVLSPMHKGAMGCRALNTALQAALGDGREEVVKGGRRFVLQDKVMQLRNNYEREVFNGDIGRVVSIDHLEGHLIVAFAEREVTYPFGELDDLDLAYAITVHKAQGSEYDAVIIPVTTAHYVMLQRNLLYTALTRASKLVVLVGTQKAVSIAVRNDDASARYTRLAARLRGEV